MLDARTMMRVIAYSSLLACLSACGKVKFESPPAASGPAVSQCEGGSCSDGSSLSPSASVEQTVLVEKTNKTDILFVIDSSGSMDTERENLGSRLANFTSKLSALDWQICVTSTDPFDDGGRLLPFGKRGPTVLTSSVPDYEGKFLDRLISTKDGTGDEQGVRSLSMAIERNNKDCFRPDAALVAVILSDEDERSTGGYPEFANDDQFKILGDANYPENLMKTVRNVFGDEKLFTAHSLVIPSNDSSCFESQKRARSNPYYGTRYEQLSKLSGGVIGSICSDDYTKELGEFAANIQQSLDSIALKCTALAAAEVTLTPAHPEISVSQQGNKVFFSPAVPDGTRVDLKYDCPDGQI